MVPGRRELRPVERLIGPEVPEPVLSGLVRLDDRVTSLLEVLRAVLSRRRVTAADVAAGGAAAQMDPPPAVREAFGAPVARRRLRDIDGFHGSQRTNAQPTWNSTQSGKWSEIRHESAFLVCPANTCGTKSTEPALL